MRAILDAVRRPEYTGEDRCWPCTALNAALLGVGVAVVWVASALAALALAIVGTAAIWLRGYLVPYTPQFAPRLAARLPGVDFHDERPAGPTTLAGDDLDGETVVEGLLAAGVVHAEGPDGDQLGLDDGFHEQWRAEMQTLRDLDDEDLAAAVLDAAPGAAMAEPHSQGDRNWVILNDESGSVAGETWLARPVAVAEAAAVRALATTVPEGDDALFAAAARPLRTFLQRCPICDGEVRETTAGSCCGGGPIPLADPSRQVLACVDCGRRVYTFEREVHTPGG